MEPESQDIFLAESCHSLLFSSIRTPVSFNLLEPTSTSDKNKASAPKLQKKVLRTRGEQFYMSGERKNRRLVLKITPQNTTLEERASLNSLSKISSGFSVSEGCNLHDLGLSSGERVVRIKCESVHNCKDPESLVHNECQTSTSHKYGNISLVMKESTASKEAVHNLNAASAFPTALFQNVYIKMEPVDSACEDADQTYDSGLQNQCTSHHQSVRHTDHANASAAVCAATCTNHRTGSRSTDSMAARQPSCSSRQMPDSSFMDGNMKPCSIKLERIPPEIAERGSVQLSQQDKILLLATQASNTSAVTALQATLAAIKPRCREGDRPYKCEQCGMTYKTTSARNQHRKVHIGIKEHSCTQCGTSFMYKSSLTAHLRTHTDERPYKCPLCDYCFRWSSHLKSHLVIHSGEKPYKCHICGASYTQNGNLQTHILSHRGERKFVCDVCKKAFVQLAHLQIHSRVHTGERPYKCDVCGAAFAHGNTLTVHKRTHTGERPYKCSKCASTFTQLPHLKMHAKVHNRPKKEPKVKCTRREKKK